MFNDLEKIFDAALKSVDPCKAVQNVMNLKDDILYVNGRTYDLNSFKNIYVTGGGKASALMARAVEDILGERITQGVICVKTGYTEKMKIIKLLEASHPVPDEKGIQAALEIEKVLNEASENDLVIALISGGASALLPLPVDGVTLDDKIKTTGLLLNSGASIHEINCVRKKISRSKGGGFAVSAYPADVINIMVSDVVGDNPDVIASGPFVEDTTGFSEALQVISKYNLSDSVPHSVMAVIKNGSTKEKAGSGITGERSECFDRVNSVICCSNITALEAAKDAAESMGYNSIILSSMIEGDNYHAVRFHRDILFEVIKSGNPVPGPACIISGGETTVNVTGSGKGGRNMDFVMRFIEYAEGLNGVLVARVGTDGTDGPTDAAGAWCDGKTLSKCRGKNISLHRMIEDNDSYNLFKAIDQLIVTGPTNTNVMDITVMLFQQH